MPEKLHFVTFNINVMKKMSCSSESDFETNSFEKDKSQEFSGEKKKLSDSLRERFSNILVYHFKPEKEENVEETLNNVGSVPINNSPNQESNPRELDRFTRNNSQPAIIFSKLTIETLEQGMKNAKN